MKVILWGTGIIYNRFFNTIIALQRLGEVEVVGVTSNENYHEKIDIFPFISKEKAISIKPDYYIVMSEYFFTDILEELYGFGIDEGRILSFRIFEIPRFRFSDYLKLKERRITIISNNCWGGILCKTMGLKCNSPTKNLFIPDKDYIKFLSDFNYYISKNPVFKRIQFDPFLKKEYPVLALEDIEIHCNHFNDPLIACERWNELKKRINYKDMFFEMCTESRDIASEFSKMSFERKVCFVPFKSDLSNVYQLKIPENYTSFWNYVKATITLEGKEFDLITLLKDGKIERRGN